MKGKKFKRKLRRVQSRMEDEFGSEISYAWLHRLATTLGAGRETSPTEDEIFVRAREEYREHDHLSV